MKSIIITAMALGLTAGAALAQTSDKPMNNDKMSPGTTGAMQNPSAPGVATDPQQVQAQQGNAGKASAGTVGAAPGADTKSQMPNGQK